MFLVLYLLVLVLFDDERASIEFKSDQLMNRGLRVYNSRKSNYFPALSAARVLVAHAPSGFNAAEFVKHSKQVFGAHSDRDVTHYDFQA